MDLLLLLKENVEQEQPDGSRWEGGKLRERGEGISLMNGRMVNREGGKAGMKRRKSVLERNWPECKWRSGGRGLVLRRERHFFAAEVSRGRNELANRKKLLVHHSKRKAKTRCGGGSVYA